MTLRLPLYLKVFLWFLLNLLLLAVVFFVLLRVQFHADLNSFFAAQVGERLQSVGEIIEKELGDSPVSAWDSILARFSSAYRVRFMLSGVDGNLLAGGNLTLPPEVAAELRRRPGQGMRWGRDGGGGGGPRWLQSDTNLVRPGPRRPGWGRMRPFFLSTEDPTRYWAGLHLPSLPLDPPELRPATLLAMSGSLGAGGFFFDLRPWIGVAAGVVVISALFWLPFVRGLTRATTRMMQTTERIAAGHFEARVASRRGDELGRLGDSINHMAERLAAFIGGQRAFLGNIAHELCSPIARIQVALGILEQRALPAQEAILKDLREEIEEMSGLVNELLSFSKASTGGTAVKLQPVPLGEIVERAVHREAAPGARIQAEIDPALRVMADPDLLLRALANVLRNAVRYAASAGPVQVTARAEGEQVLITVADQGPGVPEEALPQLFDPFFRIDLSRSRDTGGTGLGLTIVKTCIEACHGQVACQNRAPSGLEMCLRLRKG